MNGIDAELLFLLAGQLMAPLWLALAASLWVRSLRAPVDWIAVCGLPALFGAAYLALIFAALPFGEGGFGSLAAVRSLFAGDSALLAGWIHYLVFDFFIGGWIVRDARRRDIRSLPVLPCLVLCFLAGPAGLLLYLAVRMTVRRRHPKAPA
jgi:hypothetical protein